MSKRSKERKRKKQTIVKGFIDEASFYKHCLTVECDISFLGTREQNYCPICLPKIEKEDKENNRITTTVSTEMVELFLKDVNPIESFWYIATCMLLVNRIWMFCNDMVKGVIPNQRVSVEDKIAYVDSFMEIKDTLLDLTYKFYSPKLITLGMYKKIPKVDHDEVFDQKIRDYYNEIGVYDKKGILVMLRPVVIRFGHIINEYTSLETTTPTIKWLYIEEHIKSFTKAYLHGK